jgi:serine/threonine-protein kinase
MSGVHAVQALVSHAMDDWGARQRAIDGFVSESRQPCDNPDLTLGRAGTLLAAAILLEAAGTSRHVDVAGLVALGDETLTGIWSELDDQPAVEESTRITYLGMAHGWAGLLLATLRWCRASATAIPQSLPDRLHQLAELAQPAGLGVRWSWTNGQSGARRSTMPGWCNGSAGFVHLWTAAHAVFGDQRWAALAERAAWDVYAIRTGVAQLCCGLAGQAYALLELYRHSGERRWRAGAAELAAQAAAALGMGRELIPGSLHKGDVGIAVLAADLADPEAASMPFFGPAG